MGCCFSCCGLKGNEYTEADVEAYKYKQHRMHFPRGPINPAIYRGGENYSDGVPLPPHLWRPHHQQELSDIGESRPTRPASVYAYNGTIRPKHHKYATI